MQNIGVSDITMKVADQAPELSLSFKEKIELAKLLDRLNVSVIEVSPIRSRKIDSLLIKSIAMAVKHATIAVPVTLEEGSVEDTYEALKNAVNPRLQVEAPMSPTQMEYFWHKKPEKTLETIAGLIAQCREKCGEVEFIADDACRSEREFLCRAIRTAISAGATVITLCDTAGLMFPDEFARFLEEIKAAVPDMDSVRLGVMCSDEMNMATACATAAVRCGAREIKVISCKGNVTSINHFSAVMQSRGVAMGVGSDLYNTELKRVTDQIEWMCRTSRDAKSPFDSGVQSAAAHADVVLSAHDDRAAVADAVKKIGYDLSEEDVARVYEAFQRIAARKESLSAKELDTIVASAAMQVPPTYRVDTYLVTCGNTVSASAHLVLYKGETKLEGVCLGDGPIDAAFLAVEQIVGHHYELDDFQIQAVTQGREAMGETIVRLRSGGKLYSGRGISTDVVGASIRAYVSALNKIVYEEAEA